MRQGSVKKEESVRPIFYSSRTNRDQDWKNQAGNGESGFLELEM